MTTSNMTSKKKYAHKSKRTAKKDSTQLPGLEKRVADLEKRVADLEERITEIENALAASTEESDTADDPKTEEQLEGEEPVEQLGEDPS